MQLVHRMQNIRFSRVSLAIIAGLLIVGIALLNGVAPAGSQPVTDPSLDPLPIVDFDDPDMSMVVELSFNGRTNASLASAQVVPSPARAHIGDPPLLQIDAFDHAGNLIASYNGWHPMWTFVYDENGEERLVINQIATGEVVIPFSPGLSAITATDVALEEEVIEVDLDPVITEFCEDNLDNPDCATDLAVSKHASPDPAVAGESLEYTLTVENLGPNPARSYQVTDILPGGVTYNDDSADCIEAPAGTLTCAVDEVLAPGASIDFTFSVDIDADLVFNNGGPIEILNEATVENLAGADTTPANDTAVVGILVKAEADLEVVSFEATNAPGEILIGDPVEVTFEKVLANNGPSSPMDVAVSLTTVADAGLSVTADPANPTLVAALADGVNRTIEERITIECVAPGAHSVTVINQIAPDSSDDSDPDLSNNQREVTLTINCVVPVAINIHPKDYPNPVNLDSGGSIPVAVLTTEVGEYGLPMAFDALSIDPLSVRFGPANDLFDVTSPGGAPEVHADGHPKDSYELDEKTRDKDLDLVLHFEVQATGLDATDVEACVKGTFTTVGGEMFTFFGCDTILIVP